MVAPAISFSEDVEWLGRIAKLSDHVGAGATSGVAVESVLTGDDFGEILQRNLWAAAASSIASFASTHIGKLDHSPEGLDPVTHKALHGVLAVQGIILNGNPLTGAVAGIMAETIGGIYRDTVGEEALRADPELRERGINLTRFVVATAAALGQDPNLAAQTAEAAARYNSFADHTTVSAMAGQMARGSLEELEQELEGTEDKEERAVIEQKILRARSQVQYFEEDPARQLEATFSPVSSGVEAFNEQSRSESLARATESIDLALEDHHKGNILSAFGHSQNARNMGLASFFRIPNNPAEYLSAGFVGAPAISRGISSATQLFKTTHKAMRRAAHAGELASSATKAPLTKLVPLRATAPVTSAEQNFQRALTHAVEESSGLSKATASSRALAEQHVAPKSFISQAEHKMAAAEMGATRARAPVAAEHAMREGLGGVHSTRGPLVGSAEGLSIPATIDARLWNKTIEFKGNKIYQRSDLIDPHLIDLTTGKTNLDLMRMGESPYRPGWEANQSTS